ncbi:MULTISPECIES: 3-phosphoshikimate 1-carboxyvinyltransferase [unclassified Flavobacterium]|uniref:3-phosphoshikimate 1-carboxyvinyltransferase n=1 Tax=unclassified Flavobacterium TaxID=196869 RepID=UPI00086E0B85|nr:MULTISPECIES: 3-phosphoshikimate 1-carboxyvinyltransferase [unclassified Flavobacterium]MBN9284372.1 3-phosphoshikimate 1-carboxyvinyltransferase [Flavobacterium sp.]ODS78487.1 MAG: 3-phosphoshikimate 1-carboxyvinyltransferase [Chryseobacterium sp. SCN 40-13]OJV72934.1 MAG: 3-phosphoshikimate 1-carboxyvinyltransferase [Flavobacterium sp. 40-81]
MKIKLLPSEINSSSAIAITGSKSETNRLLLLQALYPELILKNTSNSDDSQVMTKALKSEETVVDIHHAGTAMRFLTSYFAVQQGREVVLTGSTRMQERPISILVDALRQLGADITYEKTEGYPPIRIKGTKIEKRQVSLKADVSSQYISALLLVAPGLENGLELTLEGTLTSIPYIKMTLALLAEIGIATTFEGNTITVAHQAKTITAQEVTVESDWSSASYFYSIAAMAKPGTTIALTSYKENSFQGDSDLVALYRHFGVESVFENNTLTLKKTAVKIEDALSFNLQNTPDIAQTIAVTCFGLGISCHLSGLHTLKIKETDRLLALQNELTKLGAVITVTNDSLTLEAAAVINPDVPIATYQDHRMAMAFAPLALRVPLVIEEAGVVSKSYPDFWEDLKKIGFKIQEINE